MRNTCFFQIDMEKSADDIHQELAAIFDRAFYSKGSGAPNSGEYRVEFTLPLPGLKALDSLSTKHNSRYTEHNPERTASD